jgi:hypothetical protein
MDSDDWATRTVSAAVAEGSGHMPSEQTTQDTLFLSLLAFDLIPSESGGGINLINGNGNA